MFDSRARTVLAFVGLAVLQVACSGARKQPPTPSPAPTASPWHDVESAAAARPGAALERAQLPRGIAQSIKELSADPAAVSGEMMFRCAQVLEEVAGRLESEPPTSGSRGGAAERIYKEWVNSVVQLFTPDGGGSGAFVRDGQHVLTSLHVVAGNRRVCVRLRPTAATPEYSSRLVLAKVIGADESADLALLKLSETVPHGKAMRLAKMDTIKIGQDVFAIGHPQGYDWTISHGIVSQIREDHVWNDVQGLLHPLQATVLQLQAGMLPGNSGGPVLNEEGELVGVGTFIAAAGGPLNFAVAVNEVESFLAAPPPYEEPRGPSVSALIAEIAEDPSFRLADGKILELDANGNGKVEVFHIDRNGDGTVDLFLFDVNENEVADGYAEDLDSNGTADLYLLDTDEDGQIDRMGTDADGDGRIDAEPNDRDLDGQPDEVRSRE